MTDDTKIFVGSLIIDFHKGVLVLLVSLTSVGPRKDQSPL